MMFTRTSGILLHPTSLPGGHGIGDLGQAAYDWVDFLQVSGQRLWQMMPLGPTGYGDSPYQCFSAFAGNPYLISLDKLVEEGLLAPEDLDGTPEFSPQFVEYGDVIPFKLEMLSRSFDHFREHGSDEQHDKLERFRESQGYWLNDYALYMACKEAHDGKAWNHWPEDLRKRDEKALVRWQIRHIDDVAKHIYWQWLFYEQWLAVRRYANERDIQIIGDIPIFVAYDSADTWANAHLFQLDDEGNPTVVAGVPPDYFSETGQRWGNPLYRWKKMKKNGFAWWIERFKSTLDFFDIIRVDHFRGFEAYWEIPASEPDAVEGRWVKGPGQDFFDAIENDLGVLPIIAEDLGVITPPVEKLRDDNDLPGMKVLQFAFAGDAHDPYLPHNYAQDSVVYTGTHDNDTTLGWYKQSSEEEKDFIRRYLARPDDDIVWHLIRAAFSSAAMFAIVPFQDVLRLDSWARMNTPGKAAGNWAWRYTAEMVQPWVTPALCDMSRVYGRIPQEGTVDTPYRQSKTNSDIEDDHDHGDDHADDHAEQTGAQEISAEQTGAEQADTPEQTVEVGSSAES